METLRADGRACDMLRPIILERAVNRYAEGSALIRWGNTHVLCTASVDDKVPPFLRGSGSGWITAEYAMLPRSTQSRMQREISRGKRDARGSEIQRLIGRSLRAAVDMTRLGERTITIDCDVLQADGGTRTASISAGFVALFDALRRMCADGKISEIPLKNQIAAVSVGKCRGVPLLVQVFVVYFGLPQLIGLTFTSFQAGCITFAFNSAAYISESLRGGIMAVDVGQREAAMALAMASLG